MDKKLGNPGDPHHILATSNLEDTQQRQPPNVTHIGWVRCFDVAQDMPSLGHIELLTVVILTQRKRGRIYNVYQGSPGQNKNRDRQIVITCCIYQPRGTHHSTSPVLPHKIAPFAYQGEEIGPIAFLVLAHKLPPDLDQTTTVGHLSMIPNKHHHLYHPNSHTLVLRMQVWYCRVQRQRHGMNIVHSIRIQCRVHAQPPRIIGINNVNLP